MGKTDRRTLTGNQTQLHDSTTCSQSGRTGIDSNTDDRPIIGIYQSQAGTRSASGVTIFVQEIVDKLARLNTTYLYTEEGEFTTKIDNSGADIVSFSQYVDEQPIYDFAARFLDSSRFVPTEVSETVRSFVNAACDGVIDHINQNVDVLLTHNVMDTVLLSNTVNVPVIRVFHSCQRIGIGAKVLKFLSHTATTVANSQQTEQEISDRLGYDPDGIVHPGVDVDAFRPDRTPAFECDVPAVMFVGRFVKEKGVFDLLDAFTETETDAHLYLVGRGDEEKVRDSIKENGIEQSVTIEGSVPHNKLPNYYAAADIVCLPSYYESFGMVNLEAMAAGTAVITSDLNGIREYAVDQETCLLIPPGDITELSSSLEQLLSSPELRTRLGETGREVAERYSWRESAEKLMEICDNTLD